MTKSTAIIAFDQHAATTVAAVFPPGHRTPALHSFPSDVATILRFVRRVQRQGAVACCYEAGPCGFELQRALTAQQIPCDVIAPALIPRRPGDRIKTDRRDARQPAVLYRAGALTAIHIPTNRKKRLAISSVVAKTSGRISGAPATAVQISAPARPPLHRDQEGLVQAARHVVAPANLAVARARPDASCLSPRR